MSTLERLTDNVSRAWENLAEGWQQLRERAGTALTRFTPGRGRGELETRDEQILDSASRWGLLAADLTETPTEIRVRLEAPGMEADQFDIQVVDGVLCVRGEKQLQREAREGRFHIFECAYGSFERRVPLPTEVDDAAATASYRRGVLRIVLPKIEQSRAKRIPVGG